MVKIIKKLVSCILIFTFIFCLNSYAVSASDGNAFITKAEFDAALSDFNARLTTFEAGINSKIDSQVSAYLDRNGIWNSKNQPIRNVTWRNELRSLWYGSSTVRTAYYYTVNTSNGLMDTSAAGSNGYAPASYYSGNRRITEQFINKSGLCYVQFNVCPISSGYNTQKPYFWMASFSINCWGSSANLTWSFKFFQTTSNATVPSLPSGEKYLYEEVISKLVEPKSYNMSAEANMWPKIKYTVAFFVKNSKYLCVQIDNLGAFTTTGFQGICSDYQTTLGNTQTCGIYMEPLKIEVY